MKSVAKGGSGYAAEDAVAAAQAESDITAPASAPDSGGEGTTPADEPPASAAQARSKEAAVSKLQKGLQNSGLTGN